jgi:hypothetical protein
MGTMQRYRTGTSCLHLLSPIGKKNRKIPMYRINIRFDLHSFWQKRIQIHGAKKTNY